VTLQEHGALPSDFVEEHVQLPSNADQLADLPAILRRYVRKTLAIVDLEAQKLRHDPTELLTRAVQPALWLVVYGEVMAKIQAIHTGYASYLDFLAPGILAQSVLFVAIFYGIAAIWERDLGIIHKFMVTPTPRTALVLGKALAAGVRALSQVLVIYALAVLLGVDLNWSLLALLGVIVIVFLGAALFATFSLIIACLVRTRERFMGIGQLLTMPLFFASSAIYPISIMPAWLQPVAVVNPLTYMVDALRMMMVLPGIGAYGLPMDFGVLIAFNVVLILLGARAYRRLVT
jgi:ABC-2 type transport system permease protein